MSQAPRYLLATAGEAATVLRRLTRDGWRTREGFALPESTWDVTEQRLLLYGRVPDMDTAALAVLAAARVYGTIGRRVAALGPAAWESRVIVRRREKLSFLFPTLVEAIRTR